nr:uncharacterized mitochondrial protein AtMg00810-like [Tanacetum cinerariifolium]
MKDKEQMSSMGELTFFLGLQVKQKKDGIFISQDKYVAEILTKFGLTKGKSASTPIDTEKPLLKDFDGEDVDVHIYRSMIGSLMYLTSSRRDIMFADSPFDLAAYSDSDYVGASLDRKTTTGGCQFLRYRLISWQCKKQTVVATSSTEAEYIPTASCCAQVLWIQNQMLDYSKSDASEGFNQIIDFLNGSYIEYALTVNPTIYVSCIKQFWNTVAVKQSNDVTRLQALVDKKKVVVTEAAIRVVLHLDDAEGVDCLPNEEIFTALARMGYEKLSTKLTFYKAFFSSQWKLLIHTILQSMSAKRTSWNEFSSTMASAVICLSTGRKFNFSKYIFESLEALDTYAALTRRVELLKHDKVAQNLEITKLKTKVKKLERANKDTTLKLRRLRKVGTSQRVDTSDDTLMEDVSNQGRIIDELDKDEGAVLMSEKEEKEIEEVKDITGDAQEAVEVVTTAKLITEVVADVNETVSATAVVPTVTAVVVPTATVTPAPVKVAVPSTRRRRGVVIKDPEEESSAKTPTETKSKDKGKGITVEEPKPMKKKQQVELDEAYAKKLHEELNQDIEWEVVIDHVKQKAKENLYVQRYQTMKKRPQTEAQARRNMMMYLKNTAGFRLDNFKGMSYDDIRLIFEAKFNSNIEFLLKTKEQIEEEENRAIASINKTLAQKAAKRRRLNEESEDVNELKQHLEIVPDEDDNVYTEATLLARKVPVVDYQIVHINNKPHFKIIRADETHQLYVSFITLLKNFDREDLESLWNIVKERFSTSKPNNFSDDFLLKTLRAMFGRPDGQDQVWMSQISVHGQARVKSWKLPESCGVHIVALTTTQLIMLV